MLERLSKNSLVLGFFFLIVSIFFGALLLLPALALQWFNTLYSPQANGWQDLVAIGLYLVSLIISGFTFGYFYSKYHLEPLSKTQKIVIPLSFIVYSGLISEILAFVETNQTKTGAFLHKLISAPYSYSLLKPLSTTIFFVLVLLLIISLIIWSLAKGSTDALKKRHENN